jgi:hypothetical protein
MGRMKELCVQVMEANNGEIPDEITIGDIIRMEELKMFEWEQYEREQQKIRLQQVKLENPREITKVAQTEQFWEEELRKEQQRAIIEEHLKNEQ